MYIHIYKYLHTYTIQILNDSFNYGHSMDICCAKYLFIFIVRLLYKHTNAYTCKPIHIFVCRVCNYNSQKWHYECINCF